MEVIPLGTWAEFENTCITIKNLTCQYRDQNGRYELFGPEDGMFIWTYTIIKQEPRSEEQADFEDNHKANFNWRVGVRQYPWSTSDFDYAGDGFQAELTEWTDNHADAYFKIEEDKIYMNGGEMFVYAGFVKGDWAEMAIADKDGIIPEAYRAAYPNWPVIKSWIKRKNLHPDGTCDCNTPYAGNPPKDMYIRVRYHRADSANRTIAVNFNLHKAI